VAASTLLRRPEVRLQSLVDAGDVALDLESSTRALDIASLENDVKYAGYLRQEESRAERMRRQERRRFPDPFPFDRVPGLSREVVHRCLQVSPEKRGQASRIPGVTPAAGAVLGAVIGGGDISKILGGAAIGAAAGTVISLGGGDVEAVLPAGSKMTLQTTQQVAF
jgi:tRNA U34 5-carboxymethylaminomethyl modifying enzyme MnmG/GidA